ncbi:MAG: tetratricopeptide repeat protein, partial [Phycisphaerales bacterium]|nr:tetratricopeptide repeat protein [Phycisphaerales bacterium]
ELGNHTFSHPNIAALPTRLAAIELNRKTFGDDYPDTLVAKSNLGLFFKRNGDNRKALEIFEPVVETSIARLGREHPKTLVFVNDLATIYTASGDHRRAADMLAEVLAIHTITLGEDHATTLTTLHNLAAVRVQLGELDAGSKLLRQAYDASTRVRGANAEGTLLDGSNLAETYRRMGRLDEAWTLATDVIERMKTHLGPAHKYTLSARCMSANVLIDQKKPEQAEPILRDGLATATAAFGPAFPLANKYRRDLAKCLDALGKADEAAEIRSQITK